MSRVRRLRRNVLSAADNWSSRASDDKPPMLPSVPQGVAWHQPTFTLPHNSRFGSHSQTTPPGSTRSAAFVADGRATMRESIH